MSKINYKKMYEDLLFEKINLQKEYDKYKNETNKINNENLNRINELSEKLKKYTAPSRNKTYYNKNKEKIIEKIKKNKPSSDKTKEYNKKSYQNRKLKKQLEQENIINNDDKNNENK